MSKLISIVVPVYNEEAILELFYHELVGTLEAETLNYEILFVDDGSSDKTRQILDSIAGSDSSVKVILLSRNFGHQAALTAGMDFASGDCVITMDSDLQHPPSLIPEMIAKWEEGYNIVYTIREETADASFLKKIASRLFYASINKLSSHSITPNAADFRLMDRKVVDSLGTIRERTRFLRGLVSWMGYSSCGIAFRAPPRRRGESKYSLKKMLAFAVDAIVSFSAKPLRLSIYLGFLTSLVSILYAVYVIYARLVKETALPGWASILFSVLFIGGIQLITTGIIGEYIAKIYEEAKQRPIYLVDRTIGKLKENVSNSSKYE